MHRCERSLAKAHVKHACVIRGRTLVYTRLIQICQRRSSRIIPFATPLSKQGIRNDVRERSSSPLVFLTNAKWYKIISPLVNAIYYMGPTWVAPSFPFCPSLSLSLPCTEQSYLFLYSSLSCPLYLASSLFHLGIRVSLAIGLAPHARSVLFIFFRASPDTHAHTHTHGHILVRVSVCDHSPRRFMARSLIHKNIIQIWRAS